MNMKEKRGRESEPDKGKARAKLEEHEKNLVFFLLLLL